MIPNDEHELAEYVREALRELGPQASEPHLRSRLVADAIDHVWAGLGVDPATGLHDLAPLEATQGEPYDLGEDPGVPDDLQASQSDAPELRPRDWQENEDLGIDHEPWDEGFGA